MNNRDKEIINILKEIDLPTNLFEQVREYEIKLEEERRKSQIKFIMIITSEIDKYLRWASDHYQMHKSEIVREALQNAIKKDKNYLNS